MPTRNRMWLPFSTGASIVTLAAASNSRLFVESIVEGTSVLDRKLSEFTVQRLLLSLSFNPATAATLVLTLGLTFQHPDVTLGLITASGDPASADWLWHEEFVSDNTGFDISNNITRDIRAVRKSKGLASELYILVENRHASVSVEYHLSGRALVLLA